MDTYQAVYDAVRSKISGGDIGSVFEDIARQALDISWQVDSVKQEYLSHAYELQRPFMLLRPKMSLDGNMWCALYGDNLQEGVAGFGFSPDEASKEFDKNWHKALTDIG